MRAVAHRMGLQDPQIWRVLPRGRSDILFLVAFDFEPGVNAWRRACAAQGWYWTRKQYAALGELQSPLSPIERDLGPAIAAVSALYESTFRDACVMDWTLDQATMELTARLRVISPR